MIAVRMLAQASSKHPAALTVGAQSLTRVGPHAGTREHVASTYLAAAFRRLTATKGGLRRPQRRFERRCYWRGGAEDLRPSAVFGRLARRSTARRSEVSGRACRIALVSAIS